MRRHILYKNLALQKWGILHIFAQSGKAFLTAIRIKLHGNGMKSTVKIILQTLVRALLGTIPAFLLAWLLLLNPFEHEADFALSDFYIRTANRTSPSLLHPNIVVVGVDGLNRMEIAHVTSLIDALGARVVALDVFMNDSSPYDTEVLASLEVCDHLVLPISLTGADSASIFPSLTNARYGYVNLDSAREGGTVRSFTLLRDGMHSFASILAGKNEPVTGLIRFDGVEFDILSPDEINGDAVRGKTVLVGNINDFSDGHMTPVGILPGVLVHAYTARTIMDGCTPRTWSTWIIILIAFLTGTLILWQHTLVSLKDGDLGNLCSRVVQICLLLLLYLVGSSLFIRQGVYADFSLPIVLAAAVLLLYDIVHGVLSLKKIWKKQNTPDHE